MNRQIFLSALPILALVAVLFAAAIAFRPVLPIDETRYLTVAWELYLHHDYSLPTLNFEPYHHKPPLLFLLIDSTWDVFGVSRWAALVPFFVAALAFIFLTKMLAQRLFPGKNALAERLPYLTLASLPFLIYSTIIMFDILLTTFVLAFFVLVFSFAEHRKKWKLVLAGFFLGLGGITKGPVVLLYTFLPLFILMIYEWKTGKKRGDHFWKSVFGLSFAAGLLPPGVWLVDLYFEIGHDFLKTLIFSQTLERINGRMESSHARPLYFYAPFLPILFLPWALFPQFWSGLKNAVSKAREDSSLMFLLAWVGGGFMVFSLISGKQPHYLVPLLPAALMMCAWALEGVGLKRIKGVAVLLVSLIVIGQAVAAQIFFPYYDLSRFAQIVASNPEKDWAFVRKYQGELGFLGRVTHHIESLEFDEVDLWFKQHPDGYAIIRHHPEHEVPKYHRMYSMPYRSRELGIYTLSPEVGELRNLPHSSDP